MSGIQKRLSALQPHIISIRCVQGISVVDAIFKDGWVVPKSEIIDVKKGEGDTNYYMFYSEKEDIGADELLDYVEKIIEINVERELKYELLKEKVKELKELFFKTPLAKLKTLRFAFSSDSLTPDIMSEDDIAFNTEEVIHTDNKTEETKKTISVKPEKVKPKVDTYANKVELPPKKGEKIEVENYDLQPEVTNGDCNCEPNEACPKCIDKKGL